MQGAVDTARANTHRSQDTHPHASTSIAPSNTYVGCAPRDTTTPTRRFLSGSERRKPPCRGKRTQTSCRPRPGSWRQPSQLPLGEAQAPQHLRKEACKDCDVMRSTQKRWALVLQRGFTRVGEAG